MSSFEAIIAVEDDFLRITTIGKYSFHELFGFIDRVKGEAERSKRSRVLIDSRLLDGKMTEAEKFQGGQRIAEVFWHRIKAAVLMPAENITKLGEMAAVNRGARFFVTHSEDEALGWLLGKDGDSDPRSRSQGPR